MGTRGVEGQVIFRDERAIVTEMAFGPYAMVTPHDNPNTAVFIVISGGGFVQVGEERARVSHGEAVVWPPGVLHGAYTDGTEMRAIVIELVGGDLPLVLEGRATEGRPLEAGVTRAEGALAVRTPLRDDYDSKEGEPW